MGRTLSFTHPLIMGIVNVTPDSFSGDGVMGHDDYGLHAIKQARQMILDGASILDIGGESSRPGSAGVETGEEKRRVIPVIEALRQNDVQCIISVDTIKADVAHAALAAGADIVNDISALAHDADMASVITQHKAWVVLMHNRSDGQAVTHDRRLGGEYHAPVYSNIVKDVMRDLQESINLALDRGITREKIILDPGLGFGKTVEQNLTLINHLDQIRAMGYPVLLGASRKGFIGRVLDQPVEERLAGTAASIALGVARGASILRVHDVRFMARIVTMAQAILQADPFAC